MTPAPHKPPAPAVIVLGLARSGTSVVTGILNILEVDMGPSVVDNSNPRGSNEDIDFAKLHKKIFDLTGPERDYWSPPSREEIRAIAPEIEAEVRELLEKKSARETAWGWKHPRTLLTCDLFLPHLANPHFVVVFRNFVGTAVSCVEHTRRRKKPMRLSEALQLVHSYHGEMLAVLDSYPQVPTHFVAYEDIVGNPVKEAEKLALFLGTALTAEAAPKVAALVIPREQLPREKKKMRSFLWGKLPRLIRKWSF